MYRFVFIDLDDTLWDFHTNARLSLEQMFNERQLNRHFENFDEFFRIYAKRNIELWEAYGKGEISKDFLMIERFRYPLSRMGVNDLELAEEIGHQYLDILPTQKELLPDAREMLTYLSEKYPLTIISNGFTEVQYKKIDSCGIRHFFKHIILSEEAGALKPNPEIFEYALKLNNAQSDEAVMIGDSWSADIAGASAAGIDQVYFRADGVFPPEHTATYKFSRLTQLKEIL